MKALKIKNAKKLIFIENKANYIDYIQNNMKEEEFVIYHGGMYSQIKGEFFRKLYSEVFYDVIDEMLKSNCKLEQEAFIGC